MNDLLFYSLVGGLFSLVGGLLLLVNAKLTDRFMTALIAFGAGALLGAVFLDILPEAVEGASEPHAVFIAVLVGFVCFFILERLIMRTVGNLHKKHDHSEHTEPLPVLLILGDCMHNFLDGIVIAIAYVANPAIGLPTALAIAAHEIPQEIGDFAILLSLKWSKKKILFINVLQSLLTIPGVVVGYYVGHVLDPYLVLLLGGAAGAFLYIAASDLIPELHHRAGHTHVYRVVCPMILSLFLMYHLIALAHGH